MKSALRSVIAFALPLGFLFLVTGCPCPDFPGGLGEPMIEFTFVPSIGSTLNLRGSVSHVLPDEHGVAVYIFVNGRWYTKPTYAEPVTRISCDGDWVCDITTGGVDSRATAVAAFLIPAAYSPPLQNGSSTELPAELEENALASVQTTRS